MKCSCCGKKKSLFESFEQLNSNLSICVDCSTLLYKLRDAKKDNNEDEFECLDNEINSKIDKKGTEEFSLWYTKFRENSNQRS